MSFDSTFNGNGVLKNMTKEERYKWDMIDAPGKFMLIPVNALKVAPSTSANYKSGKSSVLFANGHGFVVGALSS